MLRFIALLLLLSCGKPDNGSNGLNGIDGFSGLDGRDYYSYMVSVNIQERVGDGRDELFQISESNFYQLPKSIQVTVDNLYPACALQDFTLVVETDSEIQHFIFESTHNRYKMRYKSGPLNKLLDTSTVKIYYLKEPEVDCGDVVYRLHSGVTFQLRVIKLLEVD